MERKKPAASADRFQTAFDKQTSYEPDKKTYSLRCGVCGEAVSEKRRLLRSRDSTLAKLRLNYNFCDTCNRWVCGDCYLVDDGNGNGIGICTACATERGITGLTNAQFNEAWPDIQRRQNERREKSEKKRLEMKQQNREQP